MCFNDGAVISISLLPYTVSFFCHCGWIWPEQLCCFIVYFNVYVNAFIIRFRQPVLDYSVHNHPCVTVSMTAPGYSTVLSHPSFLNILLGKCEIVVAIYSSILHSSVQPELLDKLSRHFFK